MRCVFQMRPNDDASCQICNITVGIVGRLLLLRYEFESLHDDTVYTVIVNFLPATENIFFSLSNIF